MLQFIATVLFLISGMQDQGSSPFYHTIYNDSCQNQMNIFTDHDFQNLPQPFDPSNVNTQSLTQNLLHINTKRAFVGIHYYHQLLHELGIIYTDNIIGTKLANKFKKNVQKFESDLLNISLDKELFPTHSVLYLLDPGFYTFVSGVTRVKSNGNNNNARNAPLEIGFIPQRSSNEFQDYSNRFQILPSEVYVDLIGNVELISYINNLNPEIYPELYEDIREILQFGIIPSFENVMKKLLNTSVKQNKILGGRKLQLAFTLKSLEMDSRIDQFIYPGSKWHIEGLKNENILMTAIYYFHIENLSSSHLEFGIENIINQTGSSASGRNIIHLGSIESKEGRIIAFPNIYHKVAPFQLLNNATVGIRKMLVCFLIDHLKRIHSTTEVPPQQLDWYQNQFSGLINENSLDYPYSREQANEYRYAFNQERRNGRKWGGTEKRCNRD